MQKAQQLGRYLLLDRIAFGGMAEIYRAKTFDKMGRPHLVAVKRVLGHLCNDEEFLKMLVDEAKITASLRHENIARLYEFSHTDDDEYFIAMEWVDGKDVRSLLERHRARKAPIPAEHAAWVIMEVAHALDAAHNQKDGDGRPMNIVHRDVSPSNMLCSYAGEVKLCDFGIAKATLTRVQTRTGVIKGKVKYMSPEQALGRKLDNRSDLFSLGSVLYEMLTLEPPFAAPTEVELIFAVRDAHKRDARALVKTVPDELNAILNKAMTKSRSQRYQSGKEMALALRLFLDRHRPGYRRSHFARFMRSEFASEIEKELRLLEDFVVDDQVDAGMVGENLIADVLGPDAIYTQFTAARVEPDVAPRAGQVHSADTRLFEPVPVPAAVHSAETRILPQLLGPAAQEPPKPAPPAPMRQTRPPPTPPPPLPPPPSVTPVVAQAGVAPPPLPDEGLPELHVRPTQMFDRSMLPGALPELHSQETRIIRLDPPAPAPAPTPAPTPRPREGERITEETTSVPLKESDLEDV